MNPGSKSSDPPGPPQRELQWARYGTAYFLRALNELPDAGFGGPSLVGWSRAQVIAHVGYNARAVARLVRWAATGVEQPMYASVEHRRSEIELGATLRPDALRHLVHHSAVHLNVEWRDLSDTAWAAEVRTAQGRSVPAIETAWMRSREVWVHAVDLDSGASFVDFPPEFLDALLEDVVGSWRRRGLGGGITLAPDDRDYRLAADDDAAPRVVTGAATDLARWATGRGTRRVESAGRGVPEAPPWL